MKKLTALIVILLATGCSTVQRRTEPMTKWTAPEMRIAVYAPSLSDVSQALVQDALQETGAFWIVSRGQGLKAIFSEQEMIHRDQLDRFEGKEKWALWGKAHGVGAVILAQHECNNVLGLGGAIFTRCQQAVSLIDATTGELIASAVETADGETDRLPPHWDDSVAKLMKRIPKVWVEKVFEGRAAERQIAAEQNHRYTSRKFSVKDVVEEGVRK